MRSIAEHERVAPVLRFVRSCLQRVVEVEFVERSIALASLTFTAMVPVGVVVSSTLPAIDRESFADSIARRFDLDPQTANLVQDAFSPPASVRTSISVLGVLIIVGSALSFTRALQRVYERAWRLPSLGVRATPAGLIWLGGWIAFGAVFAGIRAAIVDTSRLVISVIAALQFAGIVWLASPWILLSRRIPWQRLLPTAILRRRRASCCRGGRRHLPGRSPRRSSSSCASACFAGRPIVASRRRLTRPHHRPDVSSVGPPAVPSGRWALPDVSAAAAHPFIRSA